MKKLFLICLVLGVATLSSVLVVHTVFLGMKPWLDENPHGDQIYLFFTGRFEHHPMLTTFATYHLAVAYLAKLGGAFSIDKLRIISTVLSLPLVIAAFGYAYKQTGTASVAALRAMQVFLLPILFPYLFLFYTDGFALLWLLCAAWATTSRRYFFAAVFGIFAVAVRQTNIFWLLWLGLVCCYQETVWIDTRHKVAKLGSALALYLLAFMAFTVFVIWNGGVALGDRASHPSFKFGMGSLFAFLVASTMLLLPLHIAQSKAVLGLLKRYPRQIALIAIPLSIWFLVRFNADHPYNAYPSFVHNDLAQWLNSPLNRVLIVLPMVWAALSMYIAIADRGTAVLWAVATVLSLIPVWMIEPRYYIAPFVFWLCFRKSNSPLAEWLLLLWFAGWSAAAVYIIRYTHYFL